MKKLLKSLVVMMALVGPSFAAFADDKPGADWIRKEELVKKMQSQGYSSIVAEADDGHWEGEAVKDGKIVKFHADAHTGKVIRAYPKTED